MEWVPHDVAEDILKRLPVKSLLRFKSVSKQWKKTIESRFFQDKQLAHGEQSGDPDVVMMSIRPYGVIGSGTKFLTTLVLGSSLAVEIPTPWDNTSYSISGTSCDGLVCLYNSRKPGFVVNPATRWHRPFPLCGLQQLKFKLVPRIFKVGFGKDKFTDTYKLVCLYNSSEIGLESVTTCEVFDFSINAWRFVTPSSPYRISVYHEPVYVDGFLYWFGACQKARLVSFDLRTEAFQVVSIAPLADVDPRHMCNLDNRLCVLEREWPDQVIWSFHSGNKTWDKMYSIELDIISSNTCFRKRICLLAPLALLDGKKKKKTKLLFYDRVLSRVLATHDLETKSCDVIPLSAESIGLPVCYFPSLISIS